MEKSLAIIIASIFLFLMFVLPQINGHRQIKREMRDHKILTKRLIARLTDQQLSPQLRRELLVEIIYKNTHDLEYPLQMSELDKIEFIIRSDPAFLQQGEPIHLNQIDALRLNLIKKIRA